MSAGIARSRRGSAGVMIALSLPALIGAAAIAIDLGSVELETRRLQGIADDAALSAAKNLPDAQSQAALAVGQSEYRYAVTTAATRGRYSPNTQPVGGSRFVAGDTDPNAVRIRLTSTAPTYFARVFGRNGVEISRTATAARIDYAAFSVGSRLASLDGGLLNAYLSALTGGSVSLTLLDYQALASADIDLIGYVDALRVTANITGSRADVLAAQVSPAQLLNAAANVAKSATAAAALRTLAAQAHGHNATLGSLIDLGPLAGQDASGDGTVLIDALALANALAQLTSDRHVIDIDLQGSLAGLGVQSLKLAIGERAAQSPWVTVTATGQPVLHTAQARLYVQAGLPGANIPGLSGLVSVKVPLFVELAGAEARLNRIECGANGRQVTIDAKVDAAIAAIATADTSNFGNFMMPVPLSRGRLIDTLLVDVDGYAKIDPGSVEPWQSVRFSGAEIAAGVHKTISSSSAVQGIGASLAQNVSITATVAGIIPINTSPITSAIGQQLGIAAPAIDSLINLAIGTVGVHYGEADIRVTGMRCGQPVLIG